MADNVTLDDNTTEGAVVRAIEKSGKIHPVSVLDVGTHPSDGTGQERLVSKLGGKGLPVEGMADDNDPSVGSPILVGGKYLSSASSNPVDAGDVGHFLIDATRNLRTAVFSGDNAISIDSNGAVKLVGMEDSVVNFKTGAAEGQEQYVACFGVTVPSATGPQEIKSTSIADTVSTVSQPSVTGLNVSQIGAYFGDFHSGGTDSDDITNIASFGIAIPTENGPAVVGRGGNTLPVSGTVAISSGSVNAAVSAGIAMCDLVAKKFANGHV